MIDLKYLYCTLCEKKELEVKECPICEGTICKDCEKNDKHQGCTKDLWIQS